jgi:hypothetical protein
MESNGHAISVMDITFTLAMDHGMTLRVSRCRELAQTGVLVTSRSRCRGKYPTPDGRQITAASKLFFGFWRPATRSSWIPPVPETAGRQILYRPASALYLRQA